MSRFLSVVLAAGVLASLAACGDEEKSCTVPEGVDPDWVRVIRCENDYQQLVSERDDSIFARTTTLNWIIDREDNNRVYFIDTEEWLLHFHFADAYLNIDGLTPVGTHGDFNILNYRRENRRFFLGKVIHYQDQGLKTLEISAGDTATAPMIIEAFRTIRANLYDGGELQYRPVSNDQEAMLAELSAAIPVIRTEEVFLGQQYQPLNRVVGYGTLQFRRVDELSGRPVGPTDIVVLDRVPNDISLVSGIITDEFQTPLSHVNLLSKNRGTPNMALRDAFTLPELRALDQKLVRLRVNAQGYEIEEASLLEAEEFWDSLRPSEALIPDFDESVTAPVEIADARIQDVLIVGAKAANIGELFHVEGAPFLLPDKPFALPFSMYQRHLVENGIDVDIAALLSDLENGQVSNDQLRSRLFALRWKIFSAELAPEDLQTIRAEVNSRYAADARLRFRSSTNVEDLAEFSGAGLYTSAAASVDETDAELAAAVKVVWASAWNHQAFVERDFYRVDHSRVRMGVLIHPAFEDEDANGVAVTINEFAENRPAFYINSQVGEVSVTNPTGAAVPEQLLYYTWYEEPEYEVITRSSLLVDRDDWPGGLGVLTDSELAELADILERVHNHFRPFYPTRQDFAMDVEFKLAKGRKLTIKQARPLATR